MGPSGRGEARARWQGYGDHSDCLQTPEVIVAVWKPSLTVKGALNGSHYSVAITKSYVGIFRGNPAVYGCPKYAAPSRCF